MTFKDPYSELYEALFVTLEQTGYETYGHLPDDDASYPFVFLGEQWSKDRQTSRIKSSISRCAKNRS